MKRIRTNVVRCFNVIKMNVCDTVPRCIRHFFITELVDGLSSALEKEDLVEYLQEKQEIREKRKLYRTVAHNCHIKTKCSQQITKRSHQIQIAHIKFKSLTSNSNRSQQIQITHSKLQIAHSKFKSPTANSNRSQQIKVAHSKFKLLTANSNRSQQIQIAHIKLQIINSDRRLRLSTASGTIRLKIFVIHEAATLKSSHV